VTSGTLPRSSRPVHVATENPVKACLLALLALLLVGACGPSAVKITSQPTLGGPPGRGQAGGATPRRSGPPAATPMTVPLKAATGDGTTATIHTAKGDIVIELFTESSPVSAENFINLAEAGFYTGVVFHRLVPGFVIQGGDPDGTGTGGPGYTIQDEPVVGTYGRGTVAMARTREPNSQGSQFFIVLADEAGDVLESYRTYDIFGQVSAGMDVVDAIAAMPNTGPDENRALDPVAMESVTIVRP
jgi:cyclophilin family peptidyl-prolyl cis-trans isomerase